MIAESARFSEFVKKVRGKDLDEVIHMTNLEATETERVLLRNRNRLLIKKTAIKPMLTLFKIS